MKRVVAARAGEAEPPPAGSSQPTKV